MGSATAVNLPQRLDVDSLSVIDTNRVASGSGTFPAVPGVDFGAAYDWTALLTKNSELQLQGGAFDFPSATSYTGCIPAGPDYTGIDLTTTRYATFALPVPDGAASHATLVLAQPGSAWGDGQDEPMSASCSLHVRAVDAASGADTHWLDASESFNGIFAAADGAGCLVESSAGLWQVTFGAAISGTLYIRAGVVAAAADTSFAGLTVDWCGETWERLRRAAGCNYTN
jgi:hypothetical protein